MRGKNTSPTVAVGRLPPIVRLSAPMRLAIVLLIAIVVFVALQSWLPRSTRGLIAWNAAAMTYLALTWLVVSRADATMTRVRAQAYDQSGYVIFLLVITAASASIVAIGFIVGNIKDLSFWPRAGHLALAVSALLLSWLLIQTLFAFHYARWYYWRDPGDDEHRRGLKFPGGGEPDYLDFAYYSFVVGMTSQVSDVAVTTRHMRRLTLVHGVLSFVFNIAVLAMSINLLSGVI